MEEQTTISKKEYEKLLEDSEKFKQELDELKRMLFGKKSERFIAPDEN